MDRQSCQLTSAKKADMQSADGACSACGCSQSPLDPEMAGLVGSQTQNQDSPWFLRSKGMRRLAVTIRQTDDFIEGRSLCSHQQQVFSIGAQTVMQLTYQSITHLKSEVKRLVAPHSDHQTSRKLCDHVFCTIGHQQMSKHMVHEESSRHICSVTLSVLHEQYLIIAACVLQTASGLSAFCMQNYQPHPSS